MIFSNRKIAASILAVSLALGGQALAHDDSGDKKHKEKAEGHMMMKDGEGHMDRMHKHKKMQGKLKSCMKERMDADKEQDAAKLRQNVMDHMDKCMSDMKARKKDKMDKMKKMKNGKHSHDDKKENEHNH